MIGSKSIWHDSTLLFFSLPRNLGKRSSHHQKPTAAVCSGQLRAFLLFLRNLWIIPTPMGRVTRNFFGIFKKILIFLRLFLPFLIFFLTFDHMATLPLTNVIFHVRDLQINFRKGKHLEDDKNVICNANSFVSQLPIFLLLKQCAISNNIFQGWKEIYVQWYDVRNFI